MKNTQTNLKRNQYSQRLHIALPVKDLEASRRFYQALLGVKPTKEQQGYVKFAVSQPGLNLALNERQHTQAITRPPMHFGIEVQTPELLNTIKQRLNESGVDSLAENGVTCCYAVQDKHWVNDPDGNAWEVYRVLEDANDYIEEGYKSPVINDACCDSSCCQ